MKFKRHTIKVLFFLLITNLVFGQTEVELKEKASELFEKEQYVAATSIYLQLLSLSPKSADYNFRYGTCLLFNSYHKKEAIRYLNYAVKQKGIDARSFYFYGKALHLNYQFKEAINYYQLYLSKREKRDKRYNVEREIQMCKNGQKLLVTFTDIIVKNKKEIDQSKFFRLYDNMETVGGEILVSEEFQSKMDKKKGHIPILHFPTNAKAIYYSSYGNGTNKDIYVRRRLPNGKWGEPQKLPGGVNTSEDEDFPFLHASGDFLFFSSKGHNSMGGYDIFMSRFDPNTNSFGKPENVDFAISSPDDDLFYVVDETFQNAYFASSRQSQNGKLHVYNVRVARVPIREVIIMGDFLSEINPENKEMFVNVTSFTSGESVGKIKTNKVGKYSFVFPKGGKYNYEVSVAGSEDVYKFVVELPFLDEFRPLKQKAIHTAVDGQEIIKIVNLFDEKVEGAEALIAEVIRKKAELDVNINDFDLKELDAQENRDKVLAEIGFNGMSLREVSNQLNELALTEQLKQKQIQQISSNVNNEIIEKSKLLEMYEATLSDIQSRLDESSNPSEKHELLSESLRVENEKEALIAEITHLENVKNKMASTSLTNDGSNQMKVIEERFNQLVEANKEEDALRLLTNSKDKIRKTQSESPSKIINEMVEESIALSAEIKQLNDQQISYEKEKEELHSSNIMLENSIPNAKKKDKEKIESKIESQKEELELLREMSSSSQKSIDAKNQALYVLDNNIASVQKAMLEENQFSNQQTSVDAILTEVYESKQNSDVAKIENELNQLEKEHPELSPDYIETMNEVNTDVYSFQKIEEKYKNDKNELSSVNNDWSEEEVKEKTIALNSVVVKELDDRLLIIEEESKKNGAESAKNQKLEKEKEKEQLLALKEEIIEESENLNQEILATQELKNKGQFDKIQNEYTTSIEEINTNDEISELQKNEARIDLNNETIQKIEARIIAVRSELSKNPASKERKKEQKELNALVKKLNNENTVLNNEIAVLENNESNGSNENLSIPTAESVLTEIDPEYQNRIEKIRSDETMSEIEKAEGLISEDQHLLDELVKIQRKVAKELSKTPENKELEAKNNVLNDLISTKKADILTQKQISDKQNVISELSNNEEITKKIEEEIALNYAEESKDIESSDVQGYEKEKNLLIVEQAHLDYIAERVVDTRKKLAKDEGNITLSQELDILETMENKQISNVEKQKRKAIASISAGDLEQVIIEIDENYSKDIASIDASNSSQKNVEKAAREVELQEKLQAKLVQLEKNQKRKFSVFAELDKAVYELAFEESTQREKDYTNTLDVVVENVDNQNNTTTTTTTTNQTEELLSSVKNENEILLKELTKIASSEDDNTLVIAKIKTVNLEKSKEIEQLELTAYEAKSEEEQDYLLKKAVLKQDALNSMISSTLAEQKIKQIEKEYSVEIRTQSDIEKQRRRFTVRIGELTTEIDRVETAIEEARRKEIPALTQEKKGYIAEKEFLEAKVRELEEGSHEEQDRSSFVPRSAKEKEISFNEERKIASSETYRNFEEKAVEVLEIEAQIRIIENELKEEKQKISNSINGQEPLSENEIQEGVERIKELKKEVDILNIELIQKKYLANKELPTNKDDAMKMQNLVYRGIKPLQVVAVATLLQMPTEGFSMNNSEGSSYSSENPIPVDVKNPSGLVYRVQIGAFSKPIPQDLFKEFTPVSGEKIEGTKIVRYMAGFFNNSKSVVEARQSIRNLGYSDAFIVAYCDGERIGFGEARRREANGTCIPKGSNELMVEVATNTAKKLGIPLSTEIQEVPEFSYNKAPGAANADPIEMKQGLFFTVQIGVFNRPVSDEVIYNLPEILTIRLPNGQIRYNSGLFNSVTEALPRRKESLARGIVGAFIVAYYKGKRIPIAQAKHILSENGSSVLQTEIEVKETTVIENVDLSTTRTDTVSMKNIISVEEIERVEQKRIQIVTKKEFSEFPRDVLNRYNAEGAFYFDENDHKVKSYIYTNEDDLPRLWNFVDDIDTVYLPLSSANLDTKNISVAINEAVIPGDLMDWILKTPYYHEFKETENGLDIRFYGIEKENVEEFTTQIKAFVLVPIIIDEINEE